MFLVKTLNDFVGNVLCFLFLETLKLQDGFVLSACGFCLGRYSLE